jgi:O-antigen chain-terminating methyltransferase
MVERCRAGGLQVAQGEMIAYLRSLEDGSLGGVTGLHVIEHVPFRRMIELVDQTLRVLKSGGIAIFETPNPENLTVGACTFWNDPTHQRPLPPDLAKAMFALRGFVDVRILPIHPFPSEAHLPIRDSDLRDRLNHIFYGPQDYAVLAFKAKEASTP